MASLSGQANASGLRLGAAEQEVPPVLRIHLESERQRAGLHHPLHLAVALEGAGWHPAAWREPEARPDELFRARYWADLVAEAEQATGDWRRRYALRCGVESLISQASRLSDVHHARYRGKPKTFLQHTLTAMAINLIRVDAWLTGVATTGSWTSRLARLTQATPAA